MALTGGGSVRYGNVQQGATKGGPGTTSLMGPQPSYGAPVAPTQPAPAAPMGAPVPASSRAPTGGTGFNWRSGGGSAAPGAPPSPATTQMNMPEYSPPPPVQNYQQYQPQASPVAGNLETLSGYGEGLMDPNSDYYKELVSQMRGDIGKSTAAAKRGAALTGAEQGFGAGASPEMMSVMGDIGEAGRIAEGEAMGDITLAAPQIGAGMMASTFGPGVSLEGLGEQSGQFGAGLREAGVMGRAGMAEGARQFGTNVGLTQQGMAETRAAREAQMRTQQEQWEAEFGLREDQLAEEYGAYGPAEGAYGGGGGMGARL